MIERYDILEGEGQVATSGGSTKLVGPMDEVTIDKALPQESPTQVWETLFSSRYAPPLLPGELRESTVVAFAGLVQKCG